MVEGRGDVLVLSKGGTIVLPPDNSTRIKVEVGKHGEAGAAPKRQPSPAAVSRHVVVMSQLCLMGTAIFAMTVGLSIAMHSYYMVGFDLHQKCFEAIF